jgi:hypothetical protein
MYFTAIVMSVVVVVGLLPEQALCMTAVKAVSWWSGSPNIVSYIDLRIRWRCFPRAGQHGLWEPACHIEPQRWLEDES